MFYLDRDGDGYGVDGYGRCMCKPGPPFTALKGGDCDDTNPRVNTCKPPERDASTTMDARRGSDVEISKGGGCTAGTGQGDWFVLLGLFVVLMVVLKRLVKTKSYS